MMKSSLFGSDVAGVLAAVLSIVSFGAGAAEKANVSLQIRVDWNRAIGVSKTTPTVMVVPNPILRRESGLRDAAFAALKALNSKYARYLAWYPYPRLAVAQLEAPTREKTFWDFSQIDSVMIPFMESTKGREPIISFSTIPTWMFKTHRPVSYESDPDHIDFAYSIGTELLDPTAKQLGDYQARLMRWYTQGGFTDEIGAYHRSGYHYEIPWWGVLNEPQIEHFTTPQEYTRRYDAIVSAVRKVNPTTKFLSLSLCGMRCDADEGPKFFEYFLNPANHRPGIPIDMIGYHFYAHLREGSSIEEWQFTLFEQAQAFINNVIYIDGIRKRLWPTAKLNIDELGLRVISQDAAAPQPLPKLYWNIGAAFDTYLFLQLSKHGVDVLTASHFISSEDFTPSESMMDWESGKPNARYLAQKLLNEHLGHGDTWVATTMTGPFTQEISQLKQLPELPDIDLFKQQELAAEAIRTPRGDRILLVNKTARDLDIDLSKVGRVAKTHIVDETSGDLPCKETSVGAALRLRPFAVAVLVMEAQ